MPAHFTHVAAIVVLASTVMLRLRGFAPRRVVPRRCPSSRRTATNVSHAYANTTSDSSAGHRFREAYARLQATSLRRDVAQDAAATALARLGDDVSQHLSLQTGSIFARMLHAVRGPPPVSGLYLYGGVGCGKTLLAQTLYDCVSETSVKKMQAHFHVFVLDVHTRLHAKRGLAHNKVSEVARDIASEARFLFLDEFQVTDISDALVVKSLLEQLFQRGVCILATSNRAPELLYENGLQRELFLPLIDRIHDHCQVHQIETPCDYRLRDRRSARRVWFLDVDGGVRALDDIFHTLANGMPAKEIRVDVQGRKLLVPLAVPHRRLAFFTFDELCLRPLASADYVVLCNRFHTIFVANVPTIDVIAHRNESRRFRSFVDQAYRCNVKLVINAAAHVQQLFSRPAAGDVVTEEAFESHRIESRLMEMQTDAYLERPWTPDSDQDSV